MFDEWLVSRLSKNAWALLGALLLLRRHESQFTNGELAIRAAMSKGSVVSAKQELVTKGLVTIVEAKGQPSVIRLNIQPEGFADEKDQGMDKEAGRLARSQPATLQAPDLLRPVVEKFNAAFPGHQIDMIWARQSLADAMDDIDRVVHAVDATIEKQPQYPKAYMRSICKAQGPTNVVPQPPTPELIELTQRARKYAQGQQVRSISERRAAVKREGHTG